MADWQDLSEAERAKILAIKNNQKPYQPGRNAAREGAAQRLSAAEGAARPISRISGNDSGEKAAAGEGDVLNNGSFVNKVTGGTRKDGKDSKYRGFLKKNAPAATIIALLFGGGAAMFGGFVSILPIHLSQLIKENFDVQHTSMSTRSIRMNSFILEDRPVRQDIFSGFRERYRGYSARQVRQLTRNGIEVIDVDGNVADGSAAIRRPSALRQTIEIDGELRSVDIRAADFMENFNQSNPAFRTSYMKSVRSIGSRIAGWFDFVAAKALRKIPGVRALFKDFIEETDRMHSSNRQGVSDVFNTEVDEVMNPETDGRSSSKVEESDGVDEEGNPKPALIDHDDNSNTPPVQAETDAPINVTSDTPAPAKTLSAKQVKLKEVSTKIGDMASSGQMVTNVACAGAQVWNAIQLMASALKVGQVMRYASSFLEAADRQRTGDTNQYLVSEWGDRLTTEAKDETVTSDLNIELSETSRAGINSPGMQYITETGTPNQNDNSVKSFLLDIGGGIVNMATIQGGCASMRAALAAVSAIASIGLAIATGGISILFKGFGSKLLMTAAVIGITTLVTTIIAPLVAQAFAGELINSLSLGAPVGEAIAVGSHEYNNSVGLSGGIVPGDKGAVHAYYRETQEVIARDAEFDRSQRSPFDVTSKNTFLGSIVSNSILTIINVSSFSGILTSVGSLFNKSVAAILPSANALDEARLDSFIAPEGRCPDLDSIGVVGDMYCSPMLVSDSSTIDDDPNDIINEVVGDNSDKNLEKIDDEGNVMVKPESELAKYIDRCTERQSRFGVYDNNIASDTGVVPDAFETVASVIPVVDDIIDAIEGGKEAAEYDWITGKNCVASSSNSRWGEMKYYQRFIEDGRIAESMGNIEKSPVTAYLEEKERLNPTDNSFEGYLARVSGLTKETVTETLALLMEEPIDPNVASLAPAGSGVKVSYTLPEKESDGGIIALISRIPQGISDIVSSTGSKIYRTIIGLI